MVGALPGAAFRRRDLPVTAVKIPLMEFQGTVSQVPPGGVVGEAKLAAAIRAVEQPCE